MSLSYFKTTEGILRICALLFGIITLTLSVYSHFNSHWNSHSRFQVVDGRNPGLQNDYEDCVQSRRTFSRRIPPFRRGLYDRQEVHSGSLMVHCPKPFAELFLVASSPLVVLLSLVSIIVSGIVKSGALVGPLKPFDLAIQCTSAFCFLLGGSLYIYSAYYISNWCALKAKTPLVKYTVGAEVPKFQEVPKMQSEFRIGNNLILREDVDDGRFYNGDQEQEPIEATNVKLTDVETDPRADFTDEMVVHSEEICNLQELTEEKYWCGAIAILTALMFGATMAFITNSSRGGPNQNNRQAQRLSGQEGRRSLDKAVGPGPSTRGSLVIDSNQNA
ncbi:hypothetical protein Ocin01_02128 [Orchesella cincta]|uniref:Uncharacterized protein n=1 Tax=Orchesella cincta TaxID=48709 RepID=A0A1D2NH70_ORCCI|nr:hypothetical protein Ocin01_02128 [Orchesella cincta]